MQNIIPIILSDCVLISFCAGLHKKSQKQLNFSQKFPHLSRSLFQKAYTFSVIMSKTRIMFIFSTHTDGSKIFFLIRNYIELKIVSFALRISRSHISGNIHIRPKSQPFAPSMSFRLSTTIN
eukprot:UN28156